MGGLLGNVWRRHTGALAPVLRRGGAVYGRSTIVPRLPDAVPQQTLQVSLEGHLALLSLTCQSDLILGLEVR